MSKKKGTTVKQDGIKGKLAAYFRAGYAGIYLTSYEEQRVEGELATVCHDIGFELWTWTILDSLCGPIGSESPNQVKELDPIGLLAHLKKMKSKTVVLAKDFHLFLADSNPVIVRAVKDCLAHARANNQVLVVLGCQFKLCPELEKEFALADFTLPDRQQLGKIAREIAAGAGIEISDEELELIMDAASGLTTMEAADAISLAIIESGKTKVDPAVVHREKCNVVKKNGLLEIVKNQVTLAEIGGLENLKAELFEKRHLFTKEARDYGLPTPRGILVVGQPGTGKSLTATATESVFGIPLVRLEAGKLFGKHVGESEGNWRTVFATVKAIAPVCFWIDEIDGLVSGASSSGETDGGTTARVVKTMLQDMQGNSEGIMYVFTANDIDGIPDPLIDRLDVWSVDLPTQEEREAIWSIHIAKRNRKPDGYNIHECGRLTEGFSGRQIEQVWLKAMNLAFNEKREPTDADVAAAASRFVPTSVTMAEKIEARRKRLVNRAQPAGKTQAEPKPKVSAIRSIS